MSRQIRKCQKQKSKVEQSSRRKRKVKLKHQTKGKSARARFNVNIVNNSRIGVKVTVSKTKKIPESSGEICPNSVPIKRSRADRMSYTKKESWRKTGRKSTRTTKSDTNLEFRHFENLFIRLVRYDYTPVTPRDVIDRFDALVAESEPKKKNMTCIPLPETSRVNKDSETKGLDHEALTNRNRMLISKCESKKLEEMLRKQLQVKQKKAYKDVDMENEKLNSDVLDTYEKVKDDEQNILKCLICNKTLCDNYQKMCLHYQLNHKDVTIQEIYFCDVRDCKFKTIHKDMLIWHTRSHLLASNLLEEEEYYCCECDELFDHREDLDIHVKEKHRNEKEEYPCNTCKFVTNSQYQLQSHIFKCHVPDDMKPSYSCNICGYQLSSRRFLKRHLVIVHLQK